MADAQTFPVVDGDGGDIDEYGMAASREEAIAVAEQYFADIVVDAYIARNITLSDGSHIPMAWVAVTDECRNAQLHQLGGIHDH